MARFWYALLFGVFGLLLFASVIYDMELPPKDSKFFVALSLAIEVGAVCQLVRGINELSGKRKAEQR